MSVDKFGRHSRRIRAALRGPKGEGFNLDSDGNYDIGKKRLTNLDTPQKPYDAVTKLYVDQGKLAKYKNYYKFNKYRLHDVGEPVHESDAVTLKYLKDRTPGFNDTDEWSFMNKRLSGVKRPYASDDAVTKSYLEDHTPQNEVNAWNCKKKRLHMVADPESLSDAVNVNYFTERLGHLIHTMYKRLSFEEDPFHTMDKSTWIKRNVYEPFFKDAITKSLVMHDVEQAK